METVQIGQERVAVVSQRHARLRRKLGQEDLTRLLTRDYGHEAYRVLSVLVPELLDKVPEHVFEGFKDREDWDHWRETGEDPRPDDQAEKEDELSPTAEEIILLFEAALRVNGLSRLGKLMDLAAFGARQQTSGTPDSPTPESPSSLGSPGE
jgi:hypothetical protein